MSRRRPPKPRPEPTPPWWRRLSTWVLTTIGVVITAGFVAAVTAFATRSVPPPPEPTPTPGSGFAVATQTIPKCGQVYAMSRTVNPDTELTALDAHDNAAFDDYLQTQQAAPVGSITIEIVFTGSRQRPTRILDVRVERLHTTANLNGTELRTSCGGDPETRTVTLDLDNPPRALTSNGKSYFQGRDLDVSVDERETLRISASAAQHSHRWIFAIDHVDGSGARATSYLGADGRLRYKAADVGEDAEFSLTGKAGAYGARYGESGGRFARAPG